MRVARNVNDWERMASVLAGAVLMAYAAKQQPKRRQATGAAAVGLLVRGVSGFCPVNAATGRRRRRDDSREALSGSRGIRVEESITINRPVTELYRFWRNLGNLPLFMETLERVDVVDDCRSHWVARGPGGIRVEWDAEVINEIEPELIGWRSLAGADVASAGSVRFQPAPRGGTEIHVTMQYAPPAGKLGASVAWLVGQSPASRLREDLRRLKQILEAGETPKTQGQPSGRRSAVARMMRRSA
ncbi:MAG: SRPBCC family protein [Vicinamibacterales bacterium]